MRLCILCLLMISFTSCRDGVQLMTSKKQTIIPGVQTANTYTKYLIDFKIENTIDIVIDSVFVYQKGKQCMKTDYLIKRKKSSNYISQITSKGQYILEIPIKEGSFKMINNCEADTDRVFVYYNEKGKSKHFEITSFLNETIRRRGANN